MRRIREISPHERRICRRGGGARYQPSHALLRRRQFVRAPYGARRVLFGLQRDGSEPAVAQQQGRAGRGKGNRDGRVFQPAVPRHFHRRHAAIWLLAAVRMAQPSYLTARLLPLGQNKAADAGLAARLRQVPGVVEAVTIAEENGAYLKVDTKYFDLAAAEALAGRS